MAEAPPNGVYWFAADDAARRSELDDDRVHIDVEPHGPAGASSVELATGDVVQVDHLDPTRLVGVESDLVDQAGSPLLVALFGGDGALGIVDRHHLSDPNDDVDIEDAPGGPGRTPRRAVQLDLAAQQLGRLVVLADLASDPAADPLARVVAASELIGGLDDAAGGDLLIPLVPGLVEQALSTTRQVDDDALRALDPKLAYQIISAINPLVFAAPTGRARSFLVGFVRRIELLSQRGDDEVRMVASMVPAAGPPDDLLWQDEMGAPAFADAERGRISPPTLRFVRRSPSLLEVTAHRSDRPRWVRAIRTDGLVAVALAPLQPDGLMESAELVVPPDTDLSDLDLHLVETHELQPMRAAPAALVRRAVRAGRAAASAERHGDRIAAMERWRRCAELWSRVGDDRRRRQALDRGTSRGGRVMVSPILADELDPFGVDAQLEALDAR